MKKLMKSLSNEIYCCLLFFAMCHGDNEYLYLKNSKIKRSKFTDHFRKTKDTKDIAMVLFLNSCRVQNGKELISETNISKKGNVKNSFSLNRRI